MPGRMRKSWKLAKICFAVIRKDKELLVYPVLAAIFMITFAVLSLIGIMALPFIIPLSGSCLFFILVLIISLFLIYLILYFIGVYFYAAIIACATIRLKGGEATIMDGIRTANRNLGSLFRWTFYAATVGLIIGWLTKNKNVAVQIAGHIAGVSWKMASLFVIPILIYEKKSVKDSLAQSASLFRKIWGETFRGWVGISVFIFLIFFIGILLFFPVALVGVFLGDFAFTIMMISLLVYFLLAFDLMIALKGVLVAVLYRFATTGKVEIIPEDVLGIPPTEKPFVPEDVGPAPVKTDIKHARIEEATARKLEYLKYQEERAKQKEMPRGFVKCPNCGTLNRENEEQCRMCAEYLT